MNPTLTAIETATSVIPAPTTAITTTSGSVGPLGFGHFIGQADAVGQTLLAVLLLMSVLSWAVIALKAS